LIAGFYAAFPFCFSLALGYLSCINVRIEVVYLTLSYFYPPKNHQEFYASYTFAWMVTAFNFWVTIEIGRTFGFSFLYSILLGQTTKYCLVKIEKYPEKKFEFALKQYKILATLFKLGHETSANIIWVMLGMGYCITVLTVSATIAGFGIIPKEIYWLYPSLSLMALSMFKLALPQACICFELSNRIIQKWKVRMSGKHGSKHNRKVIVSLRPSCFYCGPYRLLTDEVKVIYFESLVDRVISAVLLLNESGVT